MSLDEDRKLYPRVSDILKVFTRKDYEMISPEVLANAAARGTKVHTYCAGYAEGLWLPEIEAECQPYVTSFALWCDECIDSVILTEERLYDDELKFSGQIDMVAKLKDGSLALIDLKTSANESKSWALQLAAYDHLLKLNGYTMDIVTVLKLKKTACRVKEIPYKAEQLKSSWNLFKAATDLYAYFERKEVSHAENA